jgi:lipase ATG15
VGRLGWAVDVRHHVIREVVTKVLGADVWWGDEEADEGVGLSRGDNHLESDRPEATEAGFNPGKEGDKERKGKRNVPKAIIEEGCIVCQLSPTSFLIFLTSLFHRTVINGNLEIF